MNAVQTKLHWYEWNRAVQAMRATGAIGPRAKDAEVARKAIYARLSKPCTSIKQMGNRQLTEFLAICWAWCEIENAGLQLRAEMQAAIVARFVCRRISALIADLEPASGNKGDAYFDGIFRQQTGGADPDTGTDEQWHPVIIAVYYRYDQVARRILGITGRDGDRFWPGRHADTLREIASRHDAENPF